jgi:hypothetical protein
MNVQPTSAGVDRYLEDFAAAWLRLGEPGVGDVLVADPILVLGPEGTVPIPRTAFLAAVAGRHAIVSAAPTATTTLTGTTGMPLGDRMVLATITWSFGQGAEAANLVSDFLLQREGDDGLRCVAYLPRTNVLDNLR